MSDKQIEFMFTPVKEVFASDDFKVYATDVDKDEFPNVEFNQYGNVSIVGNMQDLTLGVDYKFIGTSQEDNYGVSYRATSIEREFPNTYNKSHKFLSEVVSEKQAEALLGVYPNAIDLIINNQTHLIDIDKVHGIGKYRMEKIEEAVIENYVLIELIDYFYGIMTLNMMRKLYDRYKSVDKIISEMTSDPYECLISLDRVGFKIADSIILDIDAHSRQDSKYSEHGFFEKLDTDISNSYVRCHAVVQYILQERALDGHTVGTITDVNREAQILLRSHKRCLSYFYDVINDSDKIIRVDDNTIALDMFYRFEYTIGKKIRNLCHKANHININTWDKIEYQKYIDEYKLTEQQSKLLEGVCCNNLICLTGYAGTGKSYALASLVDMLLDNNITFKAMSPTGRAAKVMSNYIGATATTIHRGLEYNSSKGFLRNKSNPLNVDVVIVDETSMVDSYLMYSLLNAINVTKTKLVLVGDPEQLPSVSAGNVFHDILQSNYGHTVELTQVFRYGTGGIMTAATNIRNGKLPFYKEDIGKHNIINVGEDGSYSILPFEASDVLDRVRELYMHLIDNGVSKDDILILSPKRVGKTGVRSITNYIQPYANSEHYNDKNVFIQSSDDIDVKFCIDDIVMETRNNYNATIYDGRGRFNHDTEYNTTFIPNGEIGRIVDIFPNKSGQNIGHSVVIEFEDANIIYNRGNMTSIDLSYATTIHKSQGGQAKYVILITDSSHTMLLNSNIIYVGITRAEEKCIHISKISTIAQNVTKKANYIRATLLEDMLHNPNKYDTIYKDYFLTGV